MNNKIFYIHSIYFVDTRTTISNIQTRLRRGFGTSFHSIQTVVKTLGTRDLLELQLVLLVIDQLAV